LNPKTFALSLAALALAAGGAQAAPAGKAELSYFGRSSVKIRTASGFVVYVDPYAKGDYAEPADLVLVTHGHTDHNKVSLVALRSGAAILAPKGAARGAGLQEIKEGEAKSFGPVSVRALPASNKNHARSESLGYLVSFDGIVLYHAGDTSYLPEMAGFAKYGIGWALLPCDDYWNMGPAEAAKCALAMKARRVVPIHSSGDGLYGAKNAEALAAAGASAGAGAFKGVLLEPGKSTLLEP